MLLPLCLTRPQFSVNRGAQLPFLVGRQICGFVLSEHRKQPDLLIADQKVLDNPEASTSAFASSLITPAQLSKTAGARHHVAGFRVRCEELLQRGVFIIFKVPLEMTCERWRFDEFHSIQLYALGVVYANRVVNAPAPPLRSSPPKPDRAFT